MIDHDGAVSTIDGTHGAAVVVCGVTKRFPLFARRLDRLKVMLGATSRVRFKVALDDVSVSVAPGEAIGVIGENGSGKSTLLRLVAGLTQPDAGTVATMQPVSGIIELGLGFHPDFSGRENALLYGTLVGLQERSMQERLPEVLAFADLGEFIDQPLRTYSSGMVARLAFAVASSVDPEVLVVDEALAVGDGAFQKKCIDRMMGFRKRGKTVLFCSHSMYQVASFCQRAVWLHGGRVEMLGDVSEVVTGYEAHLRRKQKADEQAAMIGQSIPSLQSGRARLRAPRLLALDGREKASLSPGEGFEIVVDFAAESQESSFHLGVAVELDDGRLLFAASTERDGIASLTGRLDYEVRLKLPALPVAEARFVVRVYLLDEHGLHLYDQAVSSEPLCITSKAWTPSLLMLPHEWVVGT